MITQTGTKESCQREEIHLSLALSFESVFFVFSITLETTKRRSDVNYSVKSCVSHTTPYFSTAFVVFVSRAITTRRTVLNDNSLQERPLNTGVNLRR